MTRRTSSELKRLAREFLTGNYTIAIFAMLIAALLPAAVLGPFTVGITIELNFAMITYVFAAFIIEILGQLLVVSMIRIHILLARKQQLSYKELLWPLNNRPDRFLLAALLLFAVLILPAVPAAVLMSCLAGLDAVHRFVFMGVTAILLLVIEIYLVLMFGLIYPLYIDHPDLPVMDGFRMSRSLMQGNKKRLLKLQLSFIGWHMLGVCSIGIGLLWIRPYITQTSANFYLDLTGQLNQAGADDIGRHIDRQL